MGKIKTPKGVASNISSAANPAASSTTPTANKSSILRSSFSPSKFQLSLFVSVIQGLDSQHLRIHDTTSGRLRCEHATASRASITCLDWGYYGENHRDRNHQESKKKRKRSELVNGDSSGKNTKNAVVAFGTSDSEVHLFSPAEAKVMGTLQGGHAQGIRDFKFADHGLHGEGWSIGGDGRLVQWNLMECKAIRIVVLPHGSANTMFPLSSSVICASHNAYILDPGSREQPQLFTASTNSVNIIISSTYRSSPNVKFLTAADHDRSITVFSADSSTSIGSLRTENEVLSLDSYSSPDQSQDPERLDTLSVRLLKPREALAAVNKDGILEIFSEPFDFGSTATKTGPEHMQESTKARMQRRSRQADAKVRVTRPDKGSTVVSLLNASFQGSEVALAWAEGGVNLVFERIQWRDETSGNLLLKNPTDIVKAKSGAGVGAVVMNGVKDMGRSHINESHTVVANGGDADDVSMADEKPEVIEISSGEEDSESEDEIPASLPNQKKPGAKEEAVPGDQDVDMEEIEAREAANQASDIEKEQPQEAEEPSFGDLIRANAPGAVDVQASFADPNAQSLVPTGEGGLQQLPSGMSLGTVLTQSLRTNDTNLLETCFHVKDLATVRATIERLDSSFATMLLQRLAERLHSRPGRAGSLMVWIQWTLVAHGGYLGGQPEVMKKLASLHRVVKDRANSLQSLLSLKGKLDMLEAQMNLRKNMQLRSRISNAMDEDDDEGIIYVEGQEESDSEEEDEDAATIESRPTRVGANARNLTENDDSEADESESDIGEEEDSEDEMLTSTNGIIANSEDEDSDSDEEGLFDEEASSTDQDSVDEGSEDRVDHESIDSVDSSDADNSPPPKRPAKSKLSNGLGSRKR